MSSAEKDAKISDAQAQYGLSSRGATGTLRDIWGPREKTMGNPWSPDNPNGTIIMRLAENSLMHSELATYIEDKIKVQPITHLTYSTGPRGSLRLRNAAASFWADRHKSRLSITADNITITPGVASGIDALEWSLCNDGEGILTPLPLYNGFIFDALNRSNVRIIGVSYDGISGCESLDDIFSPSVNELALNRALEQAQRDGIRIRALLISNPHNPLGRCYSPEAMMTFASWAGKNGLHLISDEIYANSVFENSAAKVKRFTSIVELEYEKVIDKSMVHVLYGISKDFCANGLRLGFIYTRNAGLIKAMSSISMFSWSPHVLQDVWATMLEDRNWLDDFFNQKLERMKANYDITTSWLRTNNINFIEMNAGLFIWLDFRDLLLSRAKIDQPSYRDLRAAGPNTTELRQLENELFNACSDSGVLISPGYIYEAEEYGWFRLTFTVERQMLEEGLRRLRAGLDRFKLSVEI